MFAIIWLQVMKKSHERKEKRERNRPGTDQNPDYGLFDFLYPIPDYQKCQMGIWAYAKTIWPSGVSFKRASKIEKRERNRPEPRLRFI